MPQHISSKSYAQSRNICVINSTHVLGHMVTTQALRMLLKIANIRAKNKRISSENVTALWTHILCWYPQKRRFELNTNIRLAFAEYNVTNCINFLRLKKLNYQFIQIQNFFLLLNVFRRQNKKKRARLKHVSSTLSKYIGMRCGSIKYINSRKPKKRTTAFFLFGRNVQACYGLMYELRVEQQCEHQR